MIGNSEGRKISRTVNIFAKFAETWLWEHPWPWKRPSLSLLGSKNTQSWKMNVIMIINGASTLRTRVLPKMLCEGQAFSEVVKRLLGCPHPTSEWLSLSPGSTSSFLLRHTLESPGWGLKRLWPYSALDIVGISEVKQCMEALFLFLWLSLSLLRFIYFHLKGNFCGEKERLPIC